MLFIYGFMNRQSTFFGLCIQSQTDIVTEPWSVIFQGQHSVGFFLGDLFSDNFLAAYGIVSDHRAF